MSTRRNFLKTGLLGAGAVAFGTPRLFAAEGATPPTRFVFVHKGNGLFPQACVPPTFGEEEMAAEKIRSVLLN